MNHPATISAFLNAIYYGCKAGYRRFELSFPKHEIPAYPNVCVPVAGAIEYYREQDLEFDITSVPEYIAKTSLHQPLDVTENLEVLHRSPLDRVWRFHENDVGQIVDAFLREVRQRVECKQGVLQSLEWCLNEVMDNVIVHSGIGYGYVMGQLHANNKHIAICVYDHGQGIRNSLRASQPTLRTDVDAITMAVKEGVTRDKSIGQGNGLWGLHEIVTRNEGRLTISSGSAAYSLVKNNARTYKKLPFYSNNRRSTSIDFQMDFDSSVSLSEALGHEPVNLFVESLMEEEGRFVYRVRDHAIGTGTREAGRRIRMELLNLFHETKSMIEINFDGIGVMSSSFADELIGKLVSHFGFYNFNKIFRLTNLNEFSHTVLDLSVGKRVAVDLSYRENDRMYK